MMMNMGGGPSHGHMQRLFWAFVGAAIGAAAAVHLCNLLLGLQRRMAARRSTRADTRSAPQNAMTSTFAAWTAVVREVSEALPPLRWTQRSPFTIPPLGRVLVVLLELAVVLALCFYKLDPNDHWQWEDIAYRSGCVAVAQLPLIFLLAGKNNIIGVMTGTSYERLSWIHRWAARILFLCVTLHLGFWFGSWGRYHYITRRVKHSKIAQQGLIAWSILAWINISSIAPIRKWNYELFVVQHIASYAAFTAMVYLHVGGEYRIWVWVSIGLLLFDRSVRFLRFVYINLSLFHHGKKSHGLWSCKTTFEPLTQDMTRVRIRNPPIHWSAGQHAMLSCHSVAPLQAHPFTIASIPEDGEMVFLIKTKKGGTRRFFRHAEKLQQLPFSNIEQQQRQRSVAIEGPYGQIRNLRQFDSVVLLAGASGGTFTVPLMRDIVSSWPRRNGSPQRLRWYRNQLGTVTRHIRFVWVIKSKDQFGWFSDQLNGVMHDLQKLKRKGEELEVDMSVYVTCDDSFVAEAEPCPTNRGIKRPGDTLATVTQQPKTAYHEETEKEGITIEELDSTPSESADSGQSSRRRGCGSNGACCCKAVIEDEDQISSSDQATCECTCTAANLDTRREKEEETEGITADDGMPSDKPTTLSSISEKTSPSTPFPVTTTRLSSSNDNSKQHPSISMFSGRPNVRTVINKVLEQALGETAVVVCGPPGLVADVRRSVVSLSDERAVNRGTSGAQGIYLHTEAFEY